MRIFIAILVLCGAALVAADIPLENGSTLARLPAAERSEALTRAWQPLVITLPEGRQTLAELVGHCTKAGLQLSLDAQVSGEQTVEFPGFQGTSWEAILQLCAWFAVEPRPTGDRAGEQWWSNDNRGQSLPWQSGPVVLVAGTPGLIAPPRQANGALLAEAYEVQIRQEGDAGPRLLDLALRLRQEPRANALGLSDARVTWSSVTCDGNVVEADILNTEAEQVGRLRLPVPAGSEAPLVVLRGTVQLPIQEPFLLECDLTPGDTAVVAVGEHTAKITLLDRDQAQAAGKRAACVVITYPSTELQGPFEITVTDGEHVVAAQGSSARHDFQAESEQVQYLAGLGANRHHLRISGLRRLGEVTQAVALTIDVGSLPVRSPAVAEIPGQASTVHWHAGEHTLAEALTALRTSGNDVLADLGVETTRSAHLAEFSGTFWQAALVVSNAYGLDLLPGATVTSTDGGNRRRANAASNPAQGEALLTGGAIRLARLAPGAIPPQQRCTASGPLLIEIVERTLITSRSLAGSQRDLVVHLRLRMEPRLPAAEASNAVVWWAHADLGSAVAPVRAGLPAGLVTNQLNTTAITIGLQAPQQAAIQVQGLLGFRLQETLQAKATLRLNDSTTVLLGDTPVELALALSREDQAPGLTLRYLRDRFERFEPVITDPRGNPLEIRRRSSHGNPRQMEDQWGLPALVEGVAYTITLTTQRTRAEPTLPITVLIPGGQDLPGGAATDHLQSP